MGFSLGDIAAVALNPTSVIGTAAAALVGGASDIYSANQLAKGQREANEMNRDLTREQMAFQERMSSTAHQREVEDLRKSGLNPVLSANSGASTPVGASPDIKNSAPDYRGIAQRSIASAIELATFKKSMAEADSRIDKNYAEAENARTGIKTKLPLADIGTTFHDAFKLLQDLPSAVENFKRGKKYITTEEQRSRGKSYLSPRGKNVPLNIGR